MKLYINGEWMKIVIRLVTFIVGLALLVIGLNYALIGYEMKHSMAAQVERELIYALKIIDGNSNQDSSYSINKKANIMFVGGVVGAILGLCFIVIALKG